MIFFLEVMVLLFFVLGRPLPTAPYGAPTGSPGLLAAARSSHQAQRARLDFGSALGFGFS